MNHHGPLPVDAVRDLLGICRGLYRAWAEHRPATESQLGQLRAIGQDLRSALDLATRCEADTVGHRAAWGKAERAMKQLGELVTEHDRIRPPMVALMAKVRGE